MTVNCPECLYETPVRKRGQDARCDWCRAHVGRRDHSRARRPYWRDQANGQFRRFIAQHDPTH